MDIQIVRLQSELVALETLVIATTRALQRGFPSLAASLREIANQRIEDYKHIPIRDRPPEEADLIAAELQEAFERLMKRVLLKPGD